MISTRLPQPRTKNEQLTQFLATPTPQSLLEPTPERNCDLHHVSAKRQEDGTFVLFARAPTHRSGKSVPRGDLDTFLEHMVQEVTHDRGEDVGDAVDAFRRSMGRWKHTGQAPTVSELRTLNARLSALPPSEFQLRNRGKFRVVQFQQDLRKSLDALPENAPQRDALEKAGDQLAGMLLEPKDTLSLEGLSHDTIGLLLDTGLLGRFADLRDGVKPAPKRLVLPVCAQSLLERLPPLFPDMPSWIVR
ncbi:MAG: hypothetical protein GTN84_11170 [Hydrogenophaga sp.]|uniref:hypothetical protein n=1 Tax=Hydrogenophaga sp. TaxID=1904254 RepID=UPI001691447A|nr:hypothetical protein [Hydrogenophaga sp.]NIM41645.1 hypothetical protein [Hydrogenophaga sp.]NIN26950.1 hypothetical protein [Hydrogenophaga sp.]NIN31651.1 hypothetical protein [Hydrogenophaga sp.]NIN55895.1 hypothetical protein [Hydrogenophaga sp.]NIO52022.1 hypothetical protein [Hydrogenophaga sp.]